MTTTWRSSEDARFVWVTMTDAHMAGAHDVMRRAFIPFESGCVALMVASDEQAMKDMGRMCDLVASDGASIVCLDASTDAVVAVAFNKLHTLAEENERSFSDILREEYCTCPATRAKTNYLEDIESRVNLYERYGVTCSLDLQYLAVLPQYQGRGLAKETVLATMDMAKSLVHSTSGSRVELLTGTFTSRTSQSVGRRLGWDVVVTVPHELFSYQGKKFSERIGPDHPDNVVMATRLVIS